VLGRGGCPSGQTTVKEGRCFNAGTSVARDNRLATSVQTHFFDSGSAAAVGRQERWTQRLFVWLVKGEDGGSTSRAAVARGERAGCAEHRTGEATYARGRKLENALELRGRAPAEFPDQAIARESTLDKETALWARWGAHRARVEADA